MERHYRDTEMRRIRNHMNLTQSQFCEYFHIKLSTLQMWEQEINQPSQATVYMIKRILELEGRPFVDQPKTK